MAFEFVFGLTTLRDKFDNLSPTEIMMRSLCTTLRDDYLFKVKRLEIPEDKAYTVVVTMEKGCSDIQLEWVAEIFQWYTPMGIQIIVRREH